MGGREQPDDVEIILFGPGFGESALIHIGADRWIIIDSCIDTKTGEPAALEFLKARGIEPGNVVLIVVTHWHDDHIRGLSKIVAECHNSIVCISSAFDDASFRSYVAHFARTTAIKFGTGVYEMRRTFEVMKARGQRAELGGVSKRILYLPAGERKGEYEAEVWTLSPSNRQLTDALVRFASKMSELGETKIRAPNPDQNDLSIVVWIKVNGIAFLFGADLEEHRREDTGWAAVLHHPGRPRDKAVIFKVPHHGSKNAHHDGVWADMLDAEPIAILAPYNKGKGLPTVEDVQRIRTFSTKSFATTNMRSVKLKRNRPRAVQRTLASMDVKLSSILKPAGTIRVSYSDGSTEANVSLSGGACALEELIVDHS